MEEDLTGLGYRSVYSVPVKRGINDRGINLVWHLF